MKTDRTGARYFGHDANLRNDIKIKALRRKFGLNGYAVWCLLLETLTASDGYEIILDEITVELLAADFDVTVEQFAEVVDYCKHIGLLQQEDDRLYSATLKERFVALEIEREKAAKIARQKAGKRWINATACNADATACNADATACNADATACDADATACDANATACNVDATACNADATACDANATACNADATACDADANKTILNKTILNKTKEKSMCVSSRARETHSDTDTQDFISILFFRNIKNAEAEASRFVDFYASTGWILESGRPIRDRHAKCRIWKPLPENVNPRFPPEFLPHWRKLYDRLPPNMRPLATSDRLRLDKGFNVQRLIIPRELYDWFRATPENMALAEAFVNNYAATVQEKVEIRV